MLLTWHALDVGRSLAEAHGGAEFGPLLASPSDVIRDTAPGAAGWPGLQAVLRRLLSWTLLVAAIGCAGVIAAGFALRAAAVRGGMPGEGAKGTGMVVGGFVGIAGIAALAGIAAAAEGLGALL